MTNSQEEKNSRTGGNEYEALSLVGDNIDMMGEATGGGVNDGSGKNGDGVWIHNDTDSEWIGEDGKVGEWIDENGKVGEWIDENGYGVVQDSGYATFTGQNGFIIGEKDQNNISTHRYYGCTFNCNSNGLFFGVGDNSVSSDGVKKKLLFTGLCIEDCIINASGAGISILYPEGFIGKFKNCKIHCKIIGENCDLSNFNEAVFENCDVNIINQTGEDLTVENTNPQTTTIPGISFTNPDKENKKLTLEIPIKYGLFSPTSDFGSDIVLEDHTYSIIFGDKGKHANTVLSKGNIQRHVDGYWVIRKTFFVGDSFESGKEWRIKNKDKDKVTVATVTGNTKYTHTTNTVQTNYIGEAEIELSGSGDLVLENENYDSNTSNTWNLETGDSNVVNVNLKPITWNDSSIIVSDNTTKKMFINKKDSIKFNLIHNATLTTEQSNWLSDKKKKI